VPREDRVARSAFFNHTMSDPLLIRDVMRLGVPTCKLADPLAKVAALMLDQAVAALIVLDEEADTRGWINETRLAQAYLQAVALTPDSRLLTPDSCRLTAADILNEHVPEAPSDIPLTAAGQLMADLGVDHLFMLHHAAGRAWPASMLCLRDLVRALAGPEYLKHQGMHAARPTPMDLFRQRHGLPDKR
jgi:CBS domain-containing protein